VAEPPQWEPILYAAVRLAFQRGDRTLAALLLQSEIDDVIEYHGNNADLHLVCGPEAYDQLRAYTESDDQWTASPLKDLFAAVWPANEYLGSVSLRVHAGTPASDWREQLTEALESGPSNQGRPFGTSTTHTFGGLNYRSKSEVAIAMTLEQTDQVLFFPNCAAQAGKVQREPDFLIFYKGRAGILEVDGPHHTGRLAEDSLRDSWFQGQSIFVKHYPAERCYSDPTWVVKDFLTLLLKNR
jgi:hypothetical protein